MKTSTIKQHIPIKRLKNGIFVKPNTIRFTEFTNRNLSQRLVELTFFTDVEEHPSKEFPSKGRFTRSNFFSQLLLKLKEVNNQNQHFYERKQCKKNNWIQKMDRVNRP